MGKNICCIHFHIVDCGDEDTHSHIACDASLDDTPMIDNEHAKQYCVTEEFHTCPYYPKGE